MQQSGVRDGAFSACFQPRPAVVDGLVCCRPQPNTLVSCATLSPPSRCLDLVIHSLTLGSSLPETPETTGQSLGDEANSIGRSLSRWWNMQWLQLYVIRTPVVGHGLCKCEHITVETHITIELIRSRDGSSRLLRPWNVRTINQSIPK